LHHLLKAEPVGSIQNGTGKTESVDKVETA